MSNVPTNLIPTRITGLPEYLGSSTLGYMPYIIDGRTYKVQFANIAAVGAVPSTREINTGSGLGGGGDLSANRTIYILPGGVDDSRLSATGVTAGTYGAADSVPVLTVNAQGRVTDVTLAPIVLSNYVPTSRTITAGAGLTGGGDLSANRSFAVNFSSTTPEPLGPGSPGVSTVAARGDHVHPAVDLSDTTETQGVLPLSRGGTGNSLSPVAGAIVYSSNDKLYLTTAGSVGQVLRSGGPGGVPFWTDVGAGTVTSVAVATANGFAGTVASPTLSPVITLSTTVTGMVKGNGTAVSAATAGVDYVEPGAYTASGLTMATARLLGRTTASVGAAQEISVGTGLTLSTGSLVNAAPDQVVSLTGAGTTTVTGTYPSFTITSNDSTAGTVTSVNASGGTTGMSFTGGPVTSAGTLTLNGTLAVSNGGTGATDAVAALTNLGAYPASNPAGYTSNVGTVTSVSGTGTVSGLSLSGTVTSAGSLTLGGTLVVTPSDFASQTANTVLAAPNGSAGVPTFRAIVAADIPTLNQNTTGTAGNVSGIVAVANGGTGASVASTARTNLGAAASGANTDITSIALTTGTISTSPVSGTDIVNKAYADSIASGINFHQSVRLATAAALPAYTYNNGTSGVGATITATANAALSVDGVAVAVGNRILVKNESGAAEAYNGVYTVTQTGSGSTPYILTRATDFDSAGSGVDQIDAGDFFLVTAGSTQANTSWVQQTPLPITVGTTAIVFTQFAAPVLYSAGTGLTLTGTTFSITNTGVSASTYGSASSVPVIAVNAQGQLTSASSSSIAIAASQITSGALAIANGGTGATDASGALSNLGAYPASNPAGYTSNTGTVTSVNLTAGTGVSVSGGPITASGSITVTNTAPDQVVSLTGAGATTVTGTYPNFTISSPTAGAGTVTSIDVSGGTTGLTTSGGPVTSSGTITLAGTLNVANGGTGATTLSSGYVLKGNGTSAVSASVIYDNGTNVGIGTASPASKLDLASGDLRFSGTGQRILGDFSNGTLTNRVCIQTTTASSSTNVSIIPSAAGAGLNASLNVESDPTFASGSLGQFVVVSGSEVRLTSGIRGSGTYLPMTFYTNGSERLAINTSGNVTANVDFRAPIFYDSNNTAYYADMAGTSNFNQINLGDSTKFIRGGGSGQTILGVGSVNDAYLQVGGSYYSIWNAGNFTPGNYLPLTGGTLTGNLTLNSGSPTITFSSTTSGRSSAFGMTDAYNMYLNAPGGGVLFLSNFQAPIMYDRDNTGYYLDPASTSNLVTIYANKTAANNTPAIQVRGGNPGYPRIQTYGLDADANAWMGLGTDMAGGPYEHSVYFSYGTSGQGRLSIGDYNGTTYNPRLWVYQGYTQINDATRSPIYYDSNNTGYYVDAASTSVLYQINTGIGINLSGGLALNGSGATLANSIGARLTENYGPLWNCDNSATWHHQVINGSMLCGFTAGGVNWGSGRMVANTDMRAPIFYDYNDTGYYVDPNTTATSFRGRGEIFLGPNSSYGAYLRIGGNGGQSDYSTISASNGNLHIDSQAGYDLYLNWYSARPVWSEGGAYFPIYYDRNNTAYYLDPGSTGISGMINGEMRFGGGGSSSVITTDGDFYSRRKSATTTGVYYFADGGSKFLFWDGGRYLFGNAGPADAAVSYRAPIFYDLDNTAAYVDPGGASWIKGGFQMNVPSPSNDVFGGLEMREAGLVANTQTAATYAPGINFHWGSIAAARIYMASNGAFVLGAQGDITNGRRTLFCADLNATGNVTAYYSDERLKTRKGNIKNALDIVSKLSGFRYVNNDLAKSFGYEGDEVQLGVSAQEVEAVLPEVVRQAAFDIDLDDPNHGSKSGENYKTVQYDRLVPLLIEAIKELTNKVKALEAKEQ